MTIREAHLLFRVLKDRVDSLAKEGFEAGEIDLFLNKAQLQFVQQRLDLFNKRSSGFEASQKRIDDLSTLVIKYPLQDGITPILDQGVYEVPLSSLEYPYLRLISATADATQNNCTKRTLLKFIQHDDYRDSLRDPFNSPSFEFIPFNFGRSSTDPSSSSIYIYPGSLSISKVYLEYVKEPKKVSLGNYVYVDGTTLSPQEFELPPHTHEEIVSLAVLLASLAIEDQGAQFKAQDYNLSE